MSAPGFEISMPGLPLVSADTSAAARRAACVAVISWGVDQGTVAVAHAYDALSAADQFAIWRMLELTGAVMRRVPAQETVA